MPWQIPLLAVLRHLDPSPPPLMDQAEGQCPHSDSYQRIKHTPGLWFREEGRKRAGAKTEQSKPGGRGRDAAEPENPALGRG